VTPERWRQINDLFHAVLDERPETREAFLSSAAGGDAELVREVRSLLERHESSGDFLEKPAYQVAAELILGDDPGGAAAPSLTGRQIGTYRVLEEIGRGGMGIVYAAEDTRLGRMVALKALAPAYTTDPIRRERLTREARAAAALSHPAVATVFALEEIEGELFLICELVRGETLREELRRGPLPPGLLLETLSDIAAGLAAAHQAGIVHRDLKPENVMRCGDGRIKILDFGLARMNTGQGRTTMQLTEVRTVPGTPGYMSPEQLRAGEVDARTDVFAFGIVGWELATGRHPLGVDNVELLANLGELMEGRGVASLSQPLSVPGLSLVLRRCLRVNPDERYASAAALAQDIRTLRLDRESGAPAAIAPPPALWWWQFHQIIVAVVNGLTPVAGWFVRRWAEPRPLGSIVFFTILALATISVTLRLNLLFISHVHPTSLAQHRARFYTYIAGAEALLALVLLASAALVAGDYDWMAAVLIALAVVTVASLGIIEPATTSLAEKNTSTPNS
jgi:hypothetical protein